MDGGRNLIRRVLSQNAAQLYRIDR
jgi:hypothetical protein